MKRFVSAKMFPFFAVVALALLSVCSAPRAAHATGSAYGNSGTAYTYTVGDGTINQGATNQVISGGSTVDQGVIQMDYGEISNIFMARFAPALVVIALAGAVLFAAKGGVRMVHGYLRGAFH